jgi:hypothetical protein
MMSWDHRVIRKADEEGISYQVYEVYYDKNGDYEYWTKEAMRPFGETLEELRDDIRSFFHASKMPILEFKEFEGGVTLVEVDDDDN